MSKLFENNWASPPGNTIAAALEQKGITSLQFARLIGQNEEFVSRLFSGSEIITNKLATHLSEHIGASPKFWLTRETQFRTDMVAQETFYRQEWVKSLPIKDMIKFGWINDSVNLLQECLSFFGVSDFYDWQEKYIKLIQVPAYRITKTYESDPASIASWLRQGEIIGKRTPCKEWNKAKFEESLENIKSLTRKKSPRQFLPLLKEICADCGVAVAIVRTPTGCRASGATRFLSAQKALIMLSFRYRSDDQFWFTFFHEAGHLILHDDKSLFLESVDRTVIDQREEEANAFAGETLIPFKFQKELSKLKRNKRDIIDFAMRLDISPGIVIGQMQHHDILDKKYLNSYKRTYDWDEINAHQ